MSFLEKIINIFKKNNPSKISYNPLWESIVVGRIKKSEKHPNADRLKVCIVDCGSETRTIVCGGVNVRDNMLVAVAKPGVKVHLGGAPELTELKQAVIRGVASEGMLCGADEIELSDNFPPKQEKEILDLSEWKFTPGTSLSKALQK